MPAAEPISNGEALAELFALELMARGVVEIDPESDAVKDAIQSFWTRAREAWPALGLAPEPFFGHVAPLVPAGVPLERTLERLHASDLYLAAACATGEKEALRAFEAVHLEDLRIAVARLGAGASSLDDLRQMAWQKLFVGDRERPPKIRDYSGQGRLKYWFRLAVVRMLIDLRRKTSEAQADDEQLFGLEASGSDPELEYLRRLYAHEFRTAFEEAVRALDPEQRNALRAHYVEQLTVDEIGRMLGIHRASAARRVASAREGLLAETRRRLSARLGLGRSELESVMRLVQSGLHVSLHRLLA